MTTAPAFWDKIAEKYAQRPVTDMESYEYTLARTRSYLSEQDSVLELGCGTGTTALKLAPHVSSYIATDFAERMVAIGQRKYSSSSNAPAGLSFIQADTDSAPKGPFDAVLAFNLLHLLPDLPEALTRIADRIRPGGLLISKTVCMGNAQWYLRPIIGILQMFGKAPHVAFLKPRDLESMIGDLGFEILETGTFPKRPPARFIVARKL